MDRRRALVKGLDPVPVENEAQDVIITPPKDFQDLDTSPAKDEQILLEPPAMFRHFGAAPSAVVRRNQRPKTDFFYASDAKCVFPLWPTSAGLQVDQSTEQTFHQELERLKSHSLFLRLPLDGSGTSRVQYRSSQSFIEYTSSSHHYRMRAEQVTRSFQATGSSYVADVSETESENDDDDDDDPQEPEEEEEEEDDEDDEEEEEEDENERSRSADRVPPLRPRSPSSAGSGARLSSSSGVSSSVAGASSDADADSGIDGVSPRLSSAAFGESALSPSQSGIIFIDSARSSVVHPADSDTPVAAESHNGHEAEAADRSAEGDPRRDRSHRLALELLATERTYVDVLHLLDQVFQFRVDQENRVHNMFSQELIPQMFSNIKSLFKLHHDFLLPQLEERVRQWEAEDQGPDQRRIGDIFVSFAPFLKMYAEYVRNFDHATSLIGTWTAKCPRFAAIIDEIQQRPECGQLTLQHHMLTPIQRVPRYELLLREYLRRLPEDSPDRSDTERALHLVSTAANHANEAMKKIDQFKQLLEIQESLGGAIDLVSPTRELLKEGKMVKISARSGDHQERYLFLFTDLLLLCSPRLISNRVMGVGLTPYRMRAVFNIAHLEVLEGDNLETANTFYLRQANKTVELYTSTPEEKEAWIDALFAAMTELTRRKSSLRVSPIQPHPSMAVACEDVVPAGSNGAAPGAPDSAKIGRTPPMLIRPDSVSRCASCDSQFTVMRRKHHCHACGRVMCSRCTNHKVSLPFESSSKPLRVCTDCYGQIVVAAAAKHPPASASSSSSSLGRSAVSTSQTGTDCKDPSPVSSPELSRSPPSLRTGLLEVPVETASVLSGYLSLKTRGKTWTKRWFALRSDFVLYSYKTHQGERRAMTATPVPGFTVSLANGVHQCASNASASLPSSSSASSAVANSSPAPSQPRECADGTSPSHKPVTPSNSSDASTQSGGAISERDRSFKMSHVRKTYHFQATTREDAHRWVQFLQMAARADLPSPSQLTSA